MSDTVYILVAEAKYLCFSEKVIGISQHFYPSEGAAAEAIPGFSERFAASAGDGHFAVDPATIKVRVVDVTPIEGCQKPCHGLKP